MKATPPPNRPGFSMIEMVLVIGLIAILAFIAAPLLARLVPQQRLRGEARSVATVMRQARLKAANTQKPVRVTLDCAKAGAGVDSCRVFQETANYDHGRVDGWTEIPNTRHYLDKRINLAASPKISGGAIEDDGADTPRNVFWMIFMPGGQAYSAPRPFQIDFSAADLTDPGRSNWRLTVDNNSGRTALNPVDPPAAP